MKAPNPDYVFFFSPTHQVPEVQLHEPYLTTTKGAALQAVTHGAYEQLAAVGLPINLTTYYDDLGGWLLGALLPVLLCPS